jgi:predicted permease
MAGLLGRTVRNLLAVDIGFNRDHLLLFSVDGVTAGYAQAPPLEAFYQRVSERISTVSGVRGVTYSAAAVLSRDSGNTASFQRLDDVPTTDARTETKWNQVEATFFDVYGMPFPLGRGFTSLDNATDVSVVVVNQALAAKYFPGENPVGRRVRFGRGRTRRDAEIVGVVRDFRQKDLRSETPPTLYTPAAQRPVREANFAVRTLGRPEILATAIRQAVAGLDPNVPLANLRTQAAQIEWTVAEERMIARLATFLGVAALTLASVGLYGLLAYGVIRRTSEIGLRIALGALPQQVLTMIVGESLGLVALGVLLGIGCALAVARLLASMLYGLSTTDFPTYAVATLLLVVVALAAALLPARRAAKVDPMVALRCE